MIITDFDGVLFNDKRFKKDYQRLFKRLGIPSRIHQAAYEKAKQKHPNGAYRHDIHLATMKRELRSINEQKVEKEIYAILAKSAEYLYRDAIPFLTYWKKKKTTIALVSSGSAFQKKKAEKSGLLPYFRSAVITQTALKVEPTGKIIKQYRRNHIMFMDDRASITDAIKKKFPFILVIQVARHKDQPRSRHADAIVKNLSSARIVYEKYKKSPRAVEA